MVYYKKIEILMRHIPNPAINLTTFIDSSIIYSGNYLIVKEGKDGVHHVFNLEEIKKFKLI